MNKRQKIIVSITGIIIILFILVALTYAYFLTRIQGNTNTKSIKVTMANLALVYGDGSPLILTAEEIIPSDIPIGEKTFTVTNEGNASVEYGVFLEDLINDFKYTDDLKLVITCSSNISGHTCNGYDGTMLTSNDMLLSNTIDPESTGVAAEVHTYTLTLTYEETDKDQSDDMNKNLEGKIQIYDLNDTVDLIGEVTDANNGDYVVVNSSPKKSYLKNGQFKVVGLSPGTHTINIYHSDDTPNYSKTITINKGTLQNINGTTATIVDNTRTINTTITSTELTINSLNKKNNIQTGTFAYEIIENAKNATAEQITNLYAEYSPTPKTVPSNVASGESESTLSVTEDDYGDSYYFRGNVANNYVNFAGLCWRIVRIEGDGSVKLLLEDSTYECDNASYNGNWSVGNSFWYGNVLNYNINFLNYSGGLADALKTYQTTLNTKIGTKYTSKGLSDYLKVDEWCYDDVVTDVVTGPSTYDNYKYYGAYTRIEINDQPSNICTGTKLSKFGDNITDMYVGTLTADEIVFAGTGGKYIHASNFYLKNYYAYSHSMSWWSLSPWWVMSWSSTSGTAIVLGSEGGISGGYFNGDGEHVARPAVTLKSYTEAAISGDGTKSNPYVIS